MTADLKLKLTNLPASPGVYLFRNNRGKVLYIGKAKNLRNRVRTYFQSIDKLVPRTARMVSQVHDVDLMVTASEVEAFILEANLVKEHQPRYNVNLKDDKHFPYIRVTREAFPRVQIVRRLENDGAVYFGPYTNAGGMRRTVGFLARLFRIRSCNLAIPAPPGKKYKVCLDYHIDRCKGPCEGLQSEEEYGEAIRNVVLALKGKTRELIENLTEKMNAASEEMAFEEAGHLRDQIEAIRSTMVKQHVDVGEVVDRDIISLAREERDGVAVVMQIREGVLIGRQDFQLTADVEETDERVLETFIGQYYHRQPNMPSEIFLPVTLADEKVIQDWLSQERGERVRLRMPKAGEKVRIVDLAATNARLLLDELMIRKRRFTERTSKMVTSLKDDLSLHRAPVAIACFDISNTGTTDAVGSCVFFQNGKPKKSEYRHFRIKGVTGQDDFKMMREVVGRYFFRLKEENRPAPDLVVVDGGKGQLSSALQELRAQGYADQAIIGLAKRLEEVYLPGLSDPVSVPRSSPALILLKQIRDEAHRFAITFNRKVRSQRTIKSALDDIPGIGPAKRAALLKAFGSVSKIKQATAEELAALPGITLNLAQTILSTLK